ncbi:MAG: LysE family translocator, partial [Rhodobacteraceae bacterium]|nr:LysE family translocator [Paracoccaceae bacterium]
GFFDMTSLTAADVVVICLVSALVPFLGNLAWAAVFARARILLADPVAMRRVHVAAGLALVGVGVAIALG